jgi:hypothetical protein
MPVYEDILTHYKAGTEKRLEKLKNQLTPQGES